MGALIQKPKRNTFRRCAVAAGILVSLALGDKCMRECSNPGPSGKPQEEEQERHAPVLAKTLQKRQELLQFIASSRRKQPDTGRYAGLKQLLDGELPQNFECNLSYNMPEGHEPGANPFVGLISGSAAAMSRLQSEMRIQMLSSRNLYKYSDADDLNPGAVLPSEVRRLAEQGDIGGLAFLIEEISLKPIRYFEYAEEMAAAVFYGDLFEIDERCFFKNAYALSILHSSRLALAQLLAENPNDLSVLGRLPKEDAESIIQSIANGLLSDCPELSRINGFFNSLPENLKAHFSRAVSSFDIAFQAQLFQSQILSQMPAMSGKCMSSVEKLEDVFQDLANSQNEMLRDAARTALSNYEAGRPSAQSVDVQNPAAMEGQNEPDPQGNEPPDESGL